MTNVVHVITKLDYGGAQSIARSLLLEQRARGHKVAIISGLLGPIADDLRACGILVIQEPRLVHHVSLTHDRDAVAGVAATLRRLGADVVHAHSSKGGVVGREASRRLGVPAVYTAHGWPFQPGAAVRQRVVSFAGEWIASKRHGDVVCVAASELELARKLRIASPDRLHLVHNGVGHRSEPAPTAAPVREGLRIVMVARFAPPKRHDLLIDAVRAIPSATAVLVGAGRDLAAAQSRAADLGERVRFVGYTDPSPYINDADVVVLLADYEGLPVTVLEAMRAKRAIVVNQLPGLADVVVDGISAEICSLTVTSLVGALRRLSDPILRADLADVAHGVWRSRFTIGDMADGYERVYAKVLRI